MLLLIIVIVMTETWDVISLVWFGIVDNWEWMLTVFHEMTPPAAVKPVNTPRAFLIENIMQFPGHTIFKKPIQMSLASMLNYGLASTGIVYFYK